MSKLHTFFLRSHSESPRLCVFHCAVSLTHTPLVLAPVPLQLQIINFAATLIQVST